MWPFERSLKNQDALVKYRRWLRRWLLDGDSGGERKATPGGRWPTGGFDYFRFIIFRQAVIPRRT